VKVTFKKNQSIVTVKVGTAWPFWFAFAFPAIGLLSFLRRRLYLQALLVIAYVVAQTYLRSGSAIWTGLVDLYPSAGSYLTNDAYMESQLLWLAYSLLIAPYAWHGNRLTARSLFRRGYVCPLQAEAAAAELHWSLSKINPRVMEAAVEGIHKK
jgi:hypothetical protein